VCWDGEFVPAERFACYREREGECELLEALLARNMDFRGPGGQVQESDEASSLNHSFTIEAHENPYFCLHDHGEKKWKVDKGHDFPFPRNRPSTSSP
jgi:hypothetical protein